MFPLEFPNRFCVLLPLHLQVALLHIASRARNLHGLFLSNGNVPRLISWSLNSPRGSRKESLTICHNLHLSGKQLQEANGKQSATKKWRNSIHVVSSKCISLKADDIYDKYSFSKLLWAVSGMLPRRKTIKLWQRAISDTIHIVQRTIHQLSSCLTLLSRFSPAGDTPIAEEACAAFKKITHTRLRSILDKHWRSSLFAMVSPSFYL